MAHWRQTFRNNPELQRFVLDGVRPTGKQLGVGSYGSVMELEMNGLLCAGKRLHEALLDQANAGVADVAHKYFLECQVLNQRSVHTAATNQLYCKKVNQIQCHCR